MAEKAAKGVGRRWKIQSWIRDLSTGVCRGEAKEKIGGDFMKIRIVEL